MARLTDTSEAQQKALLAHAVALLKIAEPCRIVIHGRACDNADLWTGLPIVIVFEPPGVLKVYDQVTARLLAESMPGRLETPAAVSPF